MAESIPTPRKLAPHRSTSAKLIACRRRNKTYLIVILHPVKLSSFLLGSYLPSTCQHPCKCMHFCLPKNPYFHVVTTFHHNKSAGGEQGDNFRKRCFGRFRGWQSTLSVDVAIPRFSPLG